MTTGRILEVAGLTVLAALAGVLQAHSREHCINYGDGVHTLASVPLDGFRGGVVDGSYTYVILPGIVDSIGVIDASDPSQASVVSVMPLPADGYLGISKSDDLACVARNRSDDSDLLVVDLSDPLNGYVRGSLPLEARAQGTAMKNGLVYVASGGRLLIVSLADPDAPIVLGTLSLLSDASAVHLDGDLAYVSTAQAGMYIVDVSDPFAPFEINRIRGVQYGSQWGDHLFLRPTDTTLLHSVDVSDPANPSLSDVLKVPRGVGLLSIAGGIAFVHAGWQVSLVDVSDPSALGVVGRMCGGSIRALVAKSDHLYAFYSNQVRILQLPSPEGFSVPVGSLVTSGNASFVVAARGVVYVGNSLDGADIVDASVPERPMAASTLQVPGGANQMAISGDRAFVVSNSKVRIYDIASPFDPVPIDSVSIAHGRDIAVSGELACLLRVSSYGAVSMTVLDLSAPGGAVVQGTALLGLGGNPWLADVEIDGDYAFLASGVGLWIVDLRDPNDPTLVAEIDETRVPLNVAVRDGVAYIAYGDEGVTVVDVSDPTAPLVLAEDAKRPVVDLALHGDVLYALDSSCGGVRALDVSNPSGLREIGRVSLSGSSRSRITYADGLVCVVGPWSGLNIVPAQCDGVVAAPAVVPSIRGISLGLPGPNPFVASTHLVVEVDRTQNVRVRVIDVAGRAVRTLRAGEMKRGARSVSWDGLNDEGREAAAGTYFVTAETESGRATRKVVRLPR